MPAKSPAQALLEKAEKKAASSSGWFSSSTTKWEEGGDLFQQAANAFKLDKQFQAAGDAFAKEAECREKCKELNEAANAWWNAAKAYKQGHPDLAIMALGQTIEFLTKGGRFRQAADREKEIAQIYLQELHDMRRACESYERAGEWYDQEDAKATANACYKDAADLHAELEDYPQAIARYEQVADHSLTSNLTRYSVKEYWLRASLCALAMRDTVLCKRNMQKYTALDTTFASTREAKFVNILTDAVENDDQETFTGAVVEYDQVMKLDNWKTAMLLKIKRGLQDVDEPALR
ncbi:vesicular-fusion protein SEC17 [Punctularia strigosozonata HHB-11173 SS5]|uniref:vesicular-fusion protein SEC17 n=1 Tax=Punctularia strigosozonata (strain HHB-11173) TaxID=741275 RepID=UPI000441844A|nr:vesicular-fusion protein SEC17 [Punctularia strigosozonata HHB-11173 SS5]EIN13796.1 vesicular-fusion protein SEC17 [Punctularia strigosozonata HHB-11173 SS5]